MALPPHFESSVSAPVFLCYFQTKFVNETGI